MNRLPPALDAKFKSVDYTQFLPMGKFSAVARKALTPQSIQAGARVFQQEATAFKMAQRQQLLQEMARRRAMAAQEQAKRQFQKVWPTGSSEKLLGKFMSGNKIMNPWKK